MVHCLPSPDVEYLLVDTSVGTLELPRVPFENYEMGTPF